MANNDHAVDRLEPGDGPVVAISTHLPTIEMDLLGLMRCAQLKLVAFGDAYPASPQEHNINSGDLGETAGFQVVSREAERVFPSTGFVGKASGPSTIALTFVRNLPC
jgi:hypothetical protein